MLSNEFVDATLSRSSTIELMREKRQVNNGPPPGALPGAIPGGMPGAPVGTPGALPSAMSGNFPPSSPAIPTIGITGPSAPSAPAAIPQIVGGGVPSTLPGSAPAAPSSIINPIKFPTK